MSCNGAMAISATEAQAARIKSLPLVAEKPVNIWVFDQPVDGGSFKRVRSVDSVEGENAGQAGFDEDSWNVES